MLLQQGGAAGAELWLLELRESLWYKKEPTGRKRGGETMPTGQPSESDAPDRYRAGDSGKGVTAGKRKGRMTFRFAAVLFLLSALSEIASPGAEVPLLGSFRTGATAVGYHFVFFFLYAALAVGLWRGRRWGYALVFVGAGLVTADTVQMLADIGVVTAWLDARLERFGAGAAIDPALLAAAIKTAALSIVAGWWGFAAYAYLRRDYFRETD